jgi:hypothetical protein
VIDISERGIGVISEKSLELETEVVISLFPLSKEPVRGTPVWSLYIEKDQTYYYRIGVKTENLALERIKALGFPKRSALVSEILSKIKNTSSKGKKA